MFARCYIIRLLIFCSASALLASCKVTRKVVETPLPVKLKGASVIEVFDSVMANQFRFDWLTAKASAEYAVKKENQSFDVNLRMKQDSVIWMSITPLLGIEAARVLLTKDSIRIIDRIHKNYFSRDYSYLDELLGSSVNFELIQAVITGNYFPYLKNDKIKSVYEDSLHTIISTLNKRQLKRSLEEKDPAQPIIQDFWIDAHYRIRQSVITDDLQDRSLTAQYGTLTPVNNKLFPFTLSVLIAAHVPIKIDIKYTKVIPSDPQTLPFTIPEKYYRK